MKIKFSGFDEFQSKDSSQKNPYSSIEFIDDLSIDNTVNYMRNNNNSIKLRFQLYSEEKRVSHKTDQY